MCLVCSQWNKGLLTAEEALRNLGEMIDAENEDTEEMRHYFEVSDRIMDEQVPFVEEDDEDVVSLSELDDCED